MKNYSIRKPEVLHFKDEGTLFGPNQEWYKDKWQKKAGCGPTCCSAVLWYLAKTQKDCKNLISHDWQGRDDMLKLMENLWEYVTPGNMGVNTTDIFADGAIEYGKDRGVLLKCDVLEVPASGNRPDMSKVSEYLTNSFLTDIPVAFLNLSNGKEKRLESWHWVVLTGFDSESGLTVMYDQCKKTKIDLPLWLKTTCLGGGFVSIKNIWGEK